MISAANILSLFNERRSSPRHEFEAVVEVIDIGQTNELIELVSVTRDLSVSGCFVKTTTPFPKGTSVRVRITHSGEDFTALGNVTDHVTAVGMGIAFTEIELIDRAILETWLH